MWHIYIYIHIYITEHAVRYTCVIHHHVCRYYTHVYIYIYTEIYIYIWVVVNIRSSRFGGCTTLRGAASLGRENLMT